MKLTEKNKRRIVAILFILFFVIVYKLSAQPPMRFIVPHDSIEETIYVSISETGGHYILLVSSNMYDKYDVTIGFTDGSKEEFISLGPGRCFVSKSALNKLKTIPFDSIFFDTFEETYICTGIETKYYFIERLKQ